MPCPPDLPSLGRLTAASGLEGRTIADAQGQVALRDVDGHGVFAAYHDRLRGGTVLVRTRTQRATALALLELDGLAARIVLCTPDLSAGQIATAADLAGATAIATDDADDPALVGLQLPRCVAAPVPALTDTAPGFATEWALFTSGTSGPPKLALHTLATLTAAIDRSAPPRPGRVWATFYDIRRYGGLQILLRALLGGGSILLSGDDEPGVFLERAAAAGVDFLSGTPTHWRRALLSPAAAAIAPADVRLSGEVADQAILDKLLAAYPAARVCHAFASTEAGVGFEVGDGLAGFPAAWLERDAPVQLRCVDGTLRIRSPGVAQRYAGDAAPMADADGYVDTRDLLVARDDRLHFAGRSDGVINVGGLKANPVEIEAVVNAHPRVALSRAGSRRSPIIGQVVVVDVVVRDAASGTAGLEAEILHTCRQSLAAHKVPAMVRFVPTIELSAAGKLARTAV